MFSRLPVAGPLHLVALAAVLLVSNCAAAAPLETAEVFPPGAVAFAELQDLDQAIGRLSGSDYLDAALKSPQVEQFRKSPEYRKAEAARVVAERQLGVDLLVLVRQLAGQSVAVALYPNEQNAKQPHSLALVNVPPQVLTHVRQQLDPLLTLAEDVVRPSSGPQGIETFAIADKAFLAWKDGWLAGSSRRELLDELVKRKLGQESHGLTKDEPFVAMTAALQKSQTHEGAKRLLTAYVNQAMLNQAAGGRTIPEKLDNPVGSLLLGDSLEMAARSPFVALTVDLHERGFAAALSVADNRGQAGEAHRAFFPQAGEGALGDLPTIPDLIGGFAMYRDFANWYQHREQLLQEQVLPGFDQFESGLANLLPGRDFGEDVLPTLGKRLTLIAAPQSYEHLKAPPGIQLPGFALIVELAKPEEGADLMQLVFQTVTAVGNLTAGQQGRQPWVMTSETYKDVQIGYAKYSRQPSGDPLSPVYNFLPAAARVGDKFVMSSSLDLCRKLVDNLTQPKAESVVNPLQRPSLQRTVDTQLRFDPLADILAANQEFLVGRLVQQGRSAEQAKAEFELLLGTLRGFDSLRISTALVEPLVQIRLEGTWK